MEDRVQEKNGKESRSAEGKEVMNGRVQLCVCLNVSKEKISIIKFLKIEALLRKSKRYRRIMQGICSKKK